MKNKELTITVSGTSASGKSRLLFLLKELLYGEGFNIEFDGTLDFPTEIEFDKHMSRNFDDVIEHIKETRLIILKEKQLTNK